MILGNSYYKKINKSVRWSRRLCDSNGNNTQHFTFIFCRNKILAVGQNNMVETSTKALRFAIRFNLGKIRKFPYIHSEIDAISQLWGRYIVNHRLVAINVRLNKYGELRQSKPCKSCRTLLSSLNLTTVFFSKEGMWTC